MNNDFSELNTVLQYFAVTYWDSPAIKQDVGKMLSTLTVSADIALSWILISDHN